MILLQFCNLSSYFVLLDTVSIANADAEDLPTNFHTMEREELACVCASYGIKFKVQDRKSDLIHKLESARFKKTMPLLLGN